MQIKGMNTFAWGVRPDLVLTYNDDILLEGIQIEPVNSRGHFGLNKKDLKSVQSWMVVVYFPCIPFYFFLIKGLISIFQ